MDKLEKKHHLQELLDYLKINEREFSHSLGLLPNRINHILNGRHNVSPKMAKIIMSKYEDVDYNWLRTGEGEMIKKHQIGHSNSGNYSTVSGDITINECLSELELAKVKISYLERMLKDKEEIIELLKTSNIGKKK
jgi:hypothetical protein